MNEVYASINTPILALGDELVGDPPVRPITILAIKAKRDTYLPKAVLLARVEGEKRPVYITCRIENVLNPYRLDESGNKRPIVVSDLSKLPKFEP